MTTNMSKVTKSSTTEEIIQAIIDLSKKERGRACKVCTNVSCNDCLSHWYCARNSAIRVLRNIFELPVDKDVPKAIFHLASDEADNILYEYHSDGLKRGIERCKKLDSYGKLKAKIPENVTCPVCKKVVPPSRFGYVINGDVPVCWECEMARCTVQNNDITVGG